MSEDHDRPAAAPSRMEAANDNADPGRCLPPEFVPLVRLLARQVAREWLTQTANDNRPKAPDKGRRRKE